MPKHKYFSSDIVFNQSFEAIEPDKGIIRGVKVCSEGEIRGHGVYANAKFIRDVTRHGKEHAVGVKARFGHPNMCATALGTYIGRYKNYRTKIEETESGDRHHSIADLHLDETSKNLPKLGNAWEYVMKLAQTSPDMFGNSIVFTPGESDIVKIKNEDGSEIKREEVTIEALHATDLVDEPAAVEGLFSRFADEDMAMQVTLFLDQHPEVYDLAVNHPDIVDTFLKKYEQYKLKKQQMTDKSKETRSFFDKIKDAFSAAFKAEEGQEPAIPQEVTDRMSEFDVKLKELEDENESLSKQLTDIQSVKDLEIQGLNDQIVEKQKEIESKQVDIEAKESKINQLQAASTKPGGKKGAEGSDDLVQLSDYEKALEEDLKKLKSEMSVIRTDSFTGNDN